MPSPAFATPLPVSLSTHPLTPPARRPPRARARTRRTAIAASPQPAAATSATAIPRAFDWRNQWYPVVWLDDLTTRPHAFTLWDTPLVLFRDTATGAFIVFEDVCPHRAAALSDGMLEDTPSGTQLRCGYHGWRFDARGTCTDIPYAPAAPRAACVRTVYPTAVWNGLVFVWFGDKPADGALLPVPEQFRDVGDNVLYFRNFRRHFPVSFVADVENLLDIAHVNWVHHGTGQGHRARIQREGGVDASWVDGRLVGDVRFGGVDLKIRITFQPPASIFYQSPIGFLIFLWHLPVSRDKSQLFSVHGFVNPPRVMRLFVGILPRWRECAIANLILDGDVMIQQRQFAELQRRRRDGWGGSWKKLYLLANGEWDSMVGQFREFLDVNAVGMPWERGLVGDVERLPTEEINDRFIAHTKDCVSCSRALRWAHRGLWTAGVGMALGAVFVVSAVLVRGTGSGGSRVVGAGLAGVGVCLVSALLGMLMMKMRRSFVFNTRAYDLSH